MHSLLVTFTLCAVTSAQILLQQPLPYALQHSQSHQQPISLAHRAVVENAFRESQLPPELLNNFYKNPKIVDALAKDSWLTDKEMPVFDREAEKIPRERIYKIFKDAGFIRRR